MTLTLDRSTAVDTVPFFDLTEQHRLLEAELHDVFTSTLHSAGFVGGPAIARFEEAFAAYCGVEHAIGVGSGTDALRLVLTALGVGPGDEVITVAHTFAATVEAIVQVGAKVRYVDVSADCGTMDPVALAKAISPRTRAVIPVHLYGQPADMEPILRIARGAGAAVVEDACQAHGATYQGRRAGSLADAACFSFYPSKNLGALGDAGAVTTGSADLAARIRQLRDHGQERKYVHRESGWNSRLDGLQAGFLSVKLPHLDGWNAARRRHMDRYRELLAGLDWLQLTGERPDVEGVHHLFVVRCADRDALRAHCEANGVSVALHYPIPLHRQPGFAADVSLPSTEDWAGRLLSLPMFPEMTDAQIERVAEVVRAFVPSAA